MSLATFERPGRFWKGNLHTHSTHSDGVRSPEEVCRAYREGGYDFLCLSEHFVPQYDFPITDTRPFRTNVFTTILGAEVHAGMTRFGGHWHILAVGLPLDFAHTTDREDGLTLAARCRAAGAFVVVAHPSWYGLGVDEALSIESAHAMELYNHSSAVECERGDDNAFFDQVLNLGRRWTACATDDAHFRVADWFGGWVMVKAQDLEDTALVEALKAGAYYSSTGADIFDMSVAGGVLDIACSPAARIHLLGEGSKNIRLQGHALTRASFNLEELASPWFRVTIVDEFGRKAWSNPVWL
jgi:hypothetical protein